MQILTDNYCTRYREKKYKGAISFLRKNNAAIIKSDHMLLKGKDQEITNTKLLDSYRSQAKDKINVTKALDKLISSNLILFIKNLI